MDGVVYLMIGSKHAEHLAVSLWSLLRHWAGEVAIMVGDDKAAEFCQPMGTLDRVQLIPFDYNRGKVKGSGSVYLAKTAMHKLSPFDRTVFLDADTLVAGDISDVFPEDDEIRITPWMDWTTRGKMMAGRIQEWATQAPAEVARQLAKPWPAINTGVIGFSRRCQRTMDAWAEMTARNVRFICDEVAMQLIFPDWPHVILHEKYNMTPHYLPYWAKYGPPAEIVQDLDRYIVANGSQLVRVVPEDTLRSLVVAVAGRQEPSDVRIWHGHGMKFVKDPKGRAVWWPAYRQAMAENFCGIADWTPWNGTRWRRCKLVQYLNDPAHAFVKEPADEPA